MLINRSGLYTEIDMPILIECQVLFVGFFLFLNHLKMVTLGVVHLSIKIQ